MSGLQLSSNDQTQAPKAEVKTTVKNKTLTLLQRQDTQTKLRNSLPKSVNMDINKTLLWLSSAMSKNKALAEVSSKSLLNAMMICCQLGLEPIDVIGHVYLIPFKDNVSVIIGYKGLLELTRRSGYLKKVIVRPVYKDDEFKYQFGIHENIHHIPSGNTDQNDITHFYAIAQLNTDAYQIEVMTRNEVEFYRDTYSASYKYAKSKNNTASEIWTKHFAEMGKKTVLRKLLKLLPASSEMSLANHLDNLIDTGSDQSEVIDVEWVEDI